MKIEINKVDLFLMLRKVISSGFEQPRYLAGDAPRWVSQYGPKCAHEDIGKLVFEIGALSKTYKDIIADTDAAAWKDCLKQLKKVYK